MPWCAERSAVAVLLCLALISCAGPRESGRGGFRQVSDVPVKIGPPYTIRGVTYYPRDERSYDAVGLASWYGSESGNRTANGERFRPSGISAAHKTLPLPSYVEVTALDTGRTILLRINDRGPFHGGRIIDLSRGAAEALGVLRAGQARVRVRRVQPSESDRAALRAGRSAKPRRSAAAQDAVDQPDVTAARPRAPLALDLPPAEGDARNGLWYVQVGTFADRLRAESLAPTLAQIGSASVTPTRGLWRTMIGPLSEIDARAALAQARSRGYQDAVLVRPDATH